MPTSGSSSRSSATRCSAERPCRPNASRSPRTIRTRLSAVTRPSAAEPPPDSRSPVWQGSSRAASRSITPSRKRVSTSVEADGQVGHAGPAGRHHVERVVLVGGEPDGGRLDPQRHVLGDQHDRAPAVAAALGGEVERAGQDARVVGVGAEARGEHLRVGVVELDVQRAARVADRERARPAARARCAGHRASATPCGRTTPTRGGAACPPARRSPPAAGRPRAPRTGSATTGRKGEQRCRARSSAGVPSLVRQQQVRSRVLPRGRGTTPTLRWAGLPWLGPPRHRRGRPRGPVAGPLGCVTPRPGPPGRSRIGYGSADANATGGHPGAVNCNAVS